MFLNIDDIIIGHDAVKHKVKLIGADGYSYTIENQDTKELKVINDYDVPVVHHNTYIREGNFVLDCNETRKFDFYKLTIKELNGDVRKVEYAIGKEGVMARSFNAFKNDLMQGKSARTDRQVPNFTMNIDAYLWKTVPKHIILDSCDIYIERVNIVD